MSLRGKTDMFGRKKKADKSEWASLVFAPPYPRNPESIPTQKLQEATGYLLEQLRKIILESVEIIRRTKNEETRQGRMALCEKHIARMRKIKPYATAEQLAMIHECENAVNAIYSAEKPKNTAPRIDAKQMSQEVSKTAARKSNRIGKWYRETHLFGSDTFRCSLCGSIYRKNEPVCPHCKATMKKTVTDPVWVDEMAMFDGE